MKFYAIGFALICCYFIALAFIRSNIPAEDICSFMPIEGDTCIDSNPNNTLAIRLLVLNIYGGIATAIFAAVFFFHVLWANMQNRGAGL
jgi:hypothetical protein